MFKIANIAGVALPSATTKALFLEFLDPEKLADNMQADFARQGGRNVPGADGIFQNTGNVNPQDTVDFPGNGRDPGSYTDLTVFAFSRPRLLAHDLEMTAVRQTFKPVTVGVGRRLTITLTGLGRQARITDVHWGDGKRGLQRRIFSHSYGRPGHYGMRGIVIANATVYQFSVAITVDRHHAGAEQAVAVPHNRPRLHRLAPLPSPVPPLPE
jgi:hypothetical protein